MSGLLWALVALPAVVGGSLALAGRAVDRFAVLVSLGTASTVLGLGVVTSVVRPVAATDFVAGSTLGLGVDGLSAVVVPMVSTVALLVLVFAAADIRADQARFHGLMLLFLAAVLLTATATTLPALLLGWEVMGAMSFALIGFEHRDADRVRAGTTAFVATRTGDLGLYLAAGAALAGGAGLGLADLAAASPGWRSVVAAGVLVAALGKAAQLPFSFWLSRAMQGPSPVSALLHSAAMVAMGAYLLLRLAPLLQATGWAATTAAWAGALTALLLGLVALAQRDLKQLLAASTAAQLGFVVLAAGLGAVGPGTAHLVAHAATKALLFLVAGAWLGALGTKQLAALRGAARRWPRVGLLFGIGALALAGIAPLSLWATKESVLAVALERSVPLYLVGLAAAALSAAYAGKALVLLWAEPPAAVEQGYDTEETGTRSIGALQTVPMAVLAVGAAVLGLLGLPPVSERLDTALGTGGAATPGAVELVGSALLALVVLAGVRGLVLRGRLPEPRWAADWLGLERAVHVLLVRPTSGLAAALARFDDQVLDAGLLSVARALPPAARRVAGADDSGVDAVVRVTARAGIGLGRWSEVADRRGVDELVGLVARGSRRLGSLARRPQTGQLHQYYAQAAAVLAGAVVLLVVVR